MAGLQLIAPRGISVFRRGRALVLVSPSSKLLASSVSLSNSSSSLFDSLTSSGLPPCSTSGELLGPATWIRLEGEGSSIQGLIKIRPSVLMLVQATSELSCQDVSYSRVGVVAYCNYSLDMFMRFRFSELSQAIKSCYGSTFQATGMALGMFFQAKGAFWDMETLVVSTSSLKQILCILEPFLIAIPCRSCLMIELDLPRLKFINYLKSSS